MWYDDIYIQSIQVIKNANKKLSQKEYRDIAKELDLLSPISLQAISKLNFFQLVKKLRNNN